MKFEEEKAAPESGREIGSTSNPYTASGKRRSQRNECKAMDDESDHAIRSDSDDGEKGVNDTELSDMNGAKVKTKLRRHGNGAKRRDGRTRSSHRNKSAAPSDGEETFHTEHERNRTERCRSEPARLAPHLSGKGLAPLTAQEVEAAIEDMKGHEATADSKGRRKMHVHVENTSSGRFSRYETVLDRRSPGEQAREGNDGPIPTMEQDCGGPGPTERRLSRVERSAAAVLLSLKGILAGYSVQTVYEVFLFVPPERFAQLYAPRSNEARRFYFVSATLCLAGSICAVLVGDDARADESARGAAAGTSRRALRRPSRVAPSSAVLCYFAALALTLVTSVLDMRLASLARRDGADTRDVADAGEIDSELLSNVFPWKAMSLTRSICCIIGWATECQQQFRGQHGTWIRRQAEGPCLETEIDKA